MRHFLDNRNTLGLLFMLPAGVLLLLFLTYPLGLGTWLGFTDTKVGRAGVWVGIDNYRFLWGDEVTRLALFNTLFYTFVASVLKFGLGLWLATRGQPVPTASPSAMASSVTSSAAPSPSPSPSRTAASPTPATVAVPSVSGVMLTDAQQILQSQGLKAKVVIEVSDQPAGSVVRTDPAAGVVVPVGSTVTLYVATPPATSVPPSPRASRSP